MFDEMRSFRYWRDVCVIVAGAWSFLVAIGSLA